MAQRIGPGLRLFSNLQRVIPLQQGTAAMLLYIALAVALTGHVIEYWRELHQRAAELGWSWREFQLEMHFQGRELTMDKDVCMLAILAVVLMVMGLHAPLPVTIFSGLLIAALIWLPRRKGV
jgi:hypothetical protein